MAGKLRIGSEVVTVSCGLEAIIIARHFYKMGKIKSHTFLSVVGKVLMSNLPFIPDDSVMLVGGAKISPKILSLLKGMFAGEVHVCDPDNPKHPVHRN